jgi:predicted DsbA family dithiol-disulfide isomerase
VKSRGLVPWCFIGTSRFEQLLGHLTDFATAEGLHDDLAEARELGIRGVPFFVVDGRHGVSGAQSPDVLVTALERAAADRD